MEKSGILYALSNPNWNNLIKCGVTSQLINKRISNIQTGNPENCSIIYTTKELSRPYYFERLLKNILKEYNYNREFYDINEGDVKLIFDKFNELDNENKGIKINSFRKRKLKRKKHNSLYVDI